MVVICPAVSTGCRTAKIEKGYFQSLALCKLLKNAFHTALLLMQGKNG